MPSPFDLIAFDADDTLWHNEFLYTMTQDRFKALLADYHEGEIVHGELYETEIRNLARYGYGIKAFALSMIETAVELTDGRIPGTEIRKIIDFAHEMLEAPVRVFEGVPDLLKTIARDHTIMVITKGDLFDQETKIARSGLADHFDYVEIVSDKRPVSYERILTKLGVDPARFLMVGNSLRSDVLPVLEVGGQAVWIEYHTTWEHERVEDHEAQDRAYHVLESIRDLPGWLEAHA